MTTTRLAAGALLCAMSSLALAQTALRLRTFQDRSAVTSYKLVARGGVDSLELQATADKRGAVSRLRYKTATGFDCETFVSDGRWITARDLHPWLHARSPVVTAFQVPEVHGGWLTLPIPPVCPVLKTR